MTRKQAAWARQDAWKAALREGRVVKFPELDCLKSYPTTEHARAAVVEAVGAGVAAEIVQAA